MEKTPLNPQVYHYSTPHYRTSCWVDKLLSPRTVEKDDVLEYRIGFDPATGRDKGCIALSRVVASTHSMEMRRVIFLSRRVGRRQAIERLRTEVEREQIMRSGRKSQRATLRLRRFENNRKKRRCARWCL